MTTTSRGAFDRVRLDACLSKEEPLACFVHVAYLCFVCRASQC